VNVLLFADYTVWNTSVLSVVVAGNSTLVVETNSCPEEGCQGLKPDILTEATFKWSDNASWVRVLEAGHVPSYLNAPETAFLVAQPMHHSAWSSSHVTFENATEVDFGHSCTVRCLNRFASLFSFSLTRTTVYSSTCSGF